MMEGWWQPGPHWAVPALAFFGMAMWEIRDRWLPRAAGWRTRLAAWSSISTADMKRIRWDVDSTLETVRHALYSPDATDEDRHKAMEATMGITSTVSDLGYVVFPCTDSVEGLTKWYRLLLTVMGDMVTADRLWFYVRLRRKDAHE